MDVTPNGPISSRCRPPGFLVAAALLALALAALFGRALSPGAFVYGQDTIYHDYPCLRWAWDAALSSGRAPLWCPYLFCGIPTLGTLLYCPFYPTQWLFAVAPFPTAFTLQYFMAFLWAGLGAYALARALGLGATAGVVAALAFGLSGHVVSLAHAGHMTKVLAIAWAPWALAGWTKSISSENGGGKAGGAVLAGFAVGMQILASHPQIVYYTVASGALLSLYLFDWRRARSRRLGASARFAASLALAGLLSGAQSLPLLEMSRMSNRAGGVDFAEATKTSFPPRELPEIVLPRFSGDSVRGGSGAYFGKWGDERIVTDYAGVGFLALALGALIFSRDRRRWFWLGLWALAASMALGKFSPVYWLAFRAAPGIASFRSPGTIMVLMALSTAMLAAMGAEVFVASKRNKAFNARGAGLVFVTGLLCFGFVTVLRFGQSEAFSQTNAAVVILARSVRHTLFFGGLFAATLGVALFFPNWRLAGLSALALVCALELISANRLFIQPEPAARFEAALTIVPPDPLLARRTPPARLLELGNELTNRRIVNRITNLHGYHPIVFGRYETLIRELGGYAAPATLRAFDVEYLLGPPPRGAWPPEPYALSQSPPYADARRGKVLYRARRDGPALIAAAERPVPMDRMDPMDTMDTENTHEVHTVHDLPKVHSNQSPRPPIPLSGAWRLYRPNRCRFEFALPLETSTDLLMRDPMAPGWLATTDDGRALDLRRDARYDFFRETTVPAGARAVEFRYRPFSFRLGLFLTLVGWAFCVAWMVRSFKFHKTSSRFRAVG